MAVMAGNAAQTFEGNTSKDQLFAAGRFDCMSDARIVERVYRGPVDGLDARQRLDELGKSRSPHAVARRRCDNDWQLQRPAAFARATTLCFPSNSRGPCHKPNLMIDEDKRCVFRRKGDIRTDLIGHGDLLSWLSHASPSPPCERSMRARCVRRDRRFRRV